MDNIYLVSTIHHTVAALSMIAVGPQWLENYMPDIEVFANVGILVLSHVTISDIYNTASARAGTKVLLKSTNYHYFYALI